MHVNHFKTAFRSLKKNKFYTSLNIIGLSIALSVTILVGLFLQSELSYDKHYSDYDRIYRVESHFTIQESDDYFAVTAFPMGPALKLEFPEVEEQTRFSAVDNNVYEVNKIKYFEDDIYYADESVFTIFDHKFIQGDPATALAEPDKMVLTQSFANILFPNQNAMNQEIKSGDGMTITVSGIIEDVPENSHVKFAALYSMLTLKNIFGAERYESLDPNGFWNVGFFTYVKMQPGTDMESVLNNFSDFNTKYIEPLGKQINASFEPLATPLADIHLHSKLGHDLDKGNITYVYTFFIVAIFLLLIGCINYMNLATAQSSKRSLEVGIRKVLGATGDMLRKQFMAESILTAFISLIISLFLAELLLPVFNVISGKELGMNIIANWQYYLGILVIALLVGIVSGSYPAFYLSSFLPSKVLKGKQATNRKSAMRKILVLMQFSISIIMIAGTLIVLKQLHYVQNKPLGFNQENMISVTLRDEKLINTSDTIKEEFLKIPNVLGVARASSIMGNGYPIIVQRYETKDGTMSEKAINFFQVDQDFVNMMKMSVVKGRNFDPNLESDYTESILINEAMAKALGWDEPIGKKLDFGAGPNGDSQLQTQVVGVLKDFHYASLHNNVDPVILLISKQQMREFVINISSDNIKQTLSNIESKYNSFNSEHPFNFKFLDDSLNQQYEAEQKMSKVFTYFSVLCIIIACLGLFGLASFTAEQRTREIGVRKVMGATSFSITSLLSKEFLKWVLLANLVAWPIAWFALNKWLTNFAYHIQLSDNIILFILAGLLALLIAMFTVGFRALKAANSNPAQALKYE